MIATTVKSAARDLLPLTCLVAMASGAQPAEEKANFFNDPFLQVTSAIAGCPVPEDPMITAAEMQAQSHYRAEGGLRCFQSGHCRLPNSYMYDREIIPRVKKAIDADGRFIDSSLWVEGQRRWVWLKGCVRRKGTSGYRAPVQGLKGAG